MAFVVFASSVAIATAIILAGFFLKWIIGLSVGPGTQAHELVGLIFDVTLIGCAIVWAISGAVIAVTETVASTISYINQTRG